MKIQSPIPELAIKHGIWIAKVKRMILCTSWLAYNTTDINMDRMNIWNSYTVYQPFWYRFRLG